MPTKCGKAVTKRSKAADSPDARRMPRSGGPLGCCAFAPLHDDVGPNAGDDGLDLRLLGLGHGELVEGLLEIVEKGGRVPGPDFLVSGAMC